MVGVFVLMWAELVGEVGEVFWSMGYGQQRVLHLTNLYTARSSTFLALVLMQSAVQDDTTKFIDARTSHWHIELQDGWNCTSCFKEVITPPCTVLLVCHLAKSPRVECWNSHTTPCRALRGDKGAWAAPWSIFLREPPNFP